MLEDNFTFPAYFPSDLTDLLVVPLSHPLPVVSACSVIETGTSGELLQPVPGPSCPPPPRPLPMETWKPSLERRISEMAAQIGAPEWFRYRFDLSDDPAGADHKISVWSDGYRIEFMQGAPAAWECSQERYDTEDEMLYRLFKEVAEAMNWYQAPELLGRISQEWQQRYLAERIDRRRTSHQKTKPEW